MSVQAERVELNAEGQKVVREEGRQLLARISLIAGGRVAGGVGGGGDGGDSSSAAGGGSATAASGSATATAGASASSGVGGGSLGGSIPTPTTTPSVQKFRLLVDDYIVPSEPVIDYVTRFSGLHEEDLNPATSRYAVVPYRTAYLKLRYFIDSGCIFVGHGLQNDFETANIFVPPQQVVISAN